jgi:hypothetical protein
VLEKNTFSIVILDECSQMIEPLVFIICVVFKSQFLLSELAPSWQVWDFSPPPRRRPDAAASSLDLEVCREERGRPGPHSL